MNEKDSRLEYIEKHMNDEYKNADIDIGRHYLEMKKQQDIDKQKYKEIRDFLYYVTKNKNSIETMFGSLLKVKNLFSTIDRYKMNKKSILDNKEKGISHERPFIKSDKKII